MINEKELEELQHDPEVLAAIERGFDARDRGERIRWVDVKRELGIEEQSNE